MAEKNKNSLDEKFKKDQLKFEPIKNKDLVCKDCEHAYDDEIFLCNTSQCDKFDIKPDKVLDGGECDEYSKEG